MKKIAYSLLFLAVCAVIMSCSNEETYGDKKEKERTAISKFINDSSIVVINETQFAAQDSTTDVSKNEFVYLSKSGVYMQIVRKGTGTPLEEEKMVSILCRYVEYNILNEAVQTRNDISTYAHYCDKMTVKRTGSTYTGAFVSGVMKNTYGSSSTTTASVPSGWLVPLQYINLGRQQDKVAKVKIIVPHSQGHNYASSYVYPFYYVITYQREK